MSFIPNPSLRNANPIDVLRLIRSDNVGPMTFFQLVKFAGTVEKAIAMAPELSRRGGRKKPIVVASKESAEQEFEALTDFGAHVVLYGADDYPRMLQLIPDAPPLLTRKGHAHLLTNPKLIGMVGARNASANGCMFAKKLATELGQAGYVVTSGLARGIDASTHRGALATGTIAVIGGGIDNIYPPENEILFRELSETGVILSEMPFGAKPHARSFPGRNRIIAGMTRGVVVVEASLKSGSLITANYALDYGRDVFAVPGSPLDPRSQGANKLLKDGAVMVESARDVLDNMGPLEMPPLAEPELPGFSEAPMQLPPEDAMTEARATVLQALGFSPVAMDDIVTTTGISPQLLLVVLLELELAGRIERHPGARVNLRSKEDYDAFSSSR